MMFWQPASAGLPADEGNICAEVVGGQFAHAVAYPNLCIWGNGLSGRCVFGRYNQAIWRYHRPSESFQGGAVR